MFNSYAKIRPETTRLLEMMDNGEISARDVADMALSWLSEDDVKGMMHANDIPTSEQAEDEYDGQPDEAQEWADFDPEC